MLYFIFTSGVQNYLHSKFKEMFMPSQNLSIDEGMLHWHARLAFKVYCPNKPIKKLHPVWRGHRVPVRHEAILWGVFSTNRDCYIPARWSRRVWLHIVYLTFSSVCRPLHVVPSGRIEDSEKPSNLGWKSGQQSCITMAESEMTEKYQMVL